MLIALYIYSIIFSKHMMTSTDALGLLKSSTQFSPYMSYSLFCIGAITIPEGVVLTIISQ